MAAQRAATRMPLLPRRVLQVNFDLNTITRPIAEGADSLQGLLEDGGCPRTASPAAAAGSCAIVC